MPDTELFIPDHGSPLDVTLGPEGASQDAATQFLSIFLLEGLGARDPRRNLSGSKIVLLDRKRLDLRLALHVIEDYHYATAIG